MSAYRCPEPLRSNGCVGPASRFSASLNTIAITGASGYIGRHLMAELTRRGGGRIKVLARGRHADFNAAEFGPAVTVTVGDLQAPDSLRGFLEPGCTVVNLVYLWGAGETENLVVTANLLDACRAAHVARLIHCRTAAVAGRSPDDLISEGTPCQPVTEYGITKLKVEAAILEAAHRSYFEVAILRPTAVFGPAGEPLKKLSGDLVSGNRLRNYLKSCLFAARRMNLVHVANVVASIIFLAGWTDPLRGEVFIVSDDDNPSNNFADVGRFLMREFNLPDYRLPRVPVPPGVLAFLLRCLGRNNVNPRCSFDPGKLMRLGFKRPVSFEMGLSEYATWYRASHPGS